MFIRAIFRGILEREMVAEIVYSLNNEFIIKIFFIIINNKSTECRKV